LYEEGAERPKILAIAIHPYISGSLPESNISKPFYDYIAKFSGVLHWNGEQILDWYQKAKSC